MTLGLGNPMCLLEAHAGVCLRFNYVFVRCGAFLALPVLMGPAKTEYSAAAVINDEACVL